MDELIRLIIGIVFENPVVAIIVFAVVSMLFRKRGTPPARPQQQQRRPQMPPFGGDGPFGFPGMPGGSEQETEEGPTVQERPVQARRAHLEPQATDPFEHIEDIIRASSTTEPGNSPVPSPSKRVPASPAPSKPLAPSTSSTGNFHARNAAQGMIWSEIYGPPRAVRPHRAMKR